MRKTLGVTLTTAALLFGGAGVANATASITPMPSSTMSTLADDNSSSSNDNSHSDKTGLWGLAGLLGLIGLAGLKRRNDQPAVGNPAAPGYGNPPRT